MVVSYGSSPPAEVVLADPPRDAASTGVIEDTCMRQVEFDAIRAHAFGEGPETAITTAVI
jgi:thiamine transport system substrate-binding protein